MLADVGGGFRFEDREGGADGGLCAEDSLAPVLFSGPGIPGGTVPGLCSIIDVAPTIAALFDVSMSTADGRILPLFQCF